MNPPCALWALCWALVLTGGQVNSSLAAVLCVLAAVVFGLGETLFAPTVPALVNSIAPEALRGRYNGAAALAYTAGFTIGPVLGGMALQYRLGGALLVGLIGACALAALLVVLIRRRLSGAADRIDLRPQSEPELPGTGPTVGHAPQEIPA